MKRAFFLCVVLACSASGRAHAGDHAPLVKMLEQSPSFLVRARAAFALGSAGDTGAVGALESALRDVHPAVRAAAARALGQVGGRRSVPALRRAAADSALDVSDAAKLALRAIATREVIAHAVPAPPKNATRAAQRQPSLARVRYVIVVGDMRPPGGVAAPVLTEVLRRRVTEQLRALRRVAVFSLEQMTQSVADELTRRKLPAFRIDANLTRAGVSRLRGSLEMRCEVSLLLMDEPDRTLRSMLKGAASSSEQTRGPVALQQQQLADKTIDSAVHSALSNLGDALSAAAASRDLGMAALDGPEARRRRASRR